LAGRWKRPQLSTLENNADGKARVAAAGVDCGGGGGEIKREIEIND
jgi:hypothetical protein